MKTINNRFIYFFALLILSSASVTVRAQTAVKPTMRITMDSTLAGESEKAFSMEVLPDDNNEKFILVIKNPKREKLHVYVQTARGESYSDVTSESLFRRRIDMSIADDGRYTLVVASGKKTITKDVQLNTKTEVVRTLTFN